MLLLKTVSIQIPILQYYAFFARPPAYVPVCVLCVVCGTRVLYQLSVLALVKDHERLHG